MWGGLLSTSYCYIKTIVTKSEEEKEKTGKNIVFLLITGIFLKLTLFGTSWNILLAFLSIAILALGIVKLAILSH